MGRKYWVEELSEPTPPKKAGGYVGLIALIPAVFIAVAFVSGWLGEEKPTEGGTTTENGNEVQVVKNDFNSEAYKRFVREETEKHLIQHLQAVYRGKGTYLAEDRIEYGREENRRNIGESYLSYNGYLSIEVDAEVRHTATKVAYAGDRRYTAEVTIDIVTTAADGQLHTTKQLYEVTGHIIIKRKKFPFQTNRFSKEYQVDGIELLLAK